MNKLILATTLSSTLSLSTMANAHCCNNNGGFGQAFAGALVGSMFAQPPPTPTIVVVQQPIPLTPPPSQSFEEWRRQNVPQYQPQPYNPPPYQPPTNGKQYWCGTSQRWYPEVQTCSIDWSLQHRIR